MSDAIEALQGQLVELQSQVAFQEDAMTALNEAIATQQQEILVLRRQLELLAERQKQGAGDRIEDKPPPHY